MALPPGLILRAGTPGDAPLIQRVHEESIRGLGPRWYSRAEVESWAAGLKPQRYVQAMTQGDERFLLVEPEGGGGWLAAFCSFGTDRIDNLYVHPDWARRGVGEFLLARAEAAIRDAGHGSIRVIATLVGRPLYEKRGYRVLRQREYRSRGGLLLTVLDMEKPTAAARGPGPRPGSPRRDGAAASAGPGDRR